MKIYDYASVIRSKNAGPFTLTIDLIFDCDEKFTKAFTFLSEKKDEIAKLYRVRNENVKIHPFQRIRTVKVSLPRLISSGALNDRDVYGSQQHFPLAELEI